LPGGRHERLDNSSRDQVTHFVHELWQYYRSPLAHEGTRQQIRVILADVAERMIAFVTPENDFDFFRADGTRFPPGICRMWKVQSHEAARLPMIYAAAWDVTKNERYREQWRKVCRRGYHAVCDSRREQARLRAAADAMLTGGAPCPGA
jgi:hypothetical protein